MNPTVKKLLVTAAFIAAVVVIDRKTGIFTNLLSKIPGVNSLLG